MRIIELATMQECEISGKTVVALGNFDGCHLGHIAVFKEAYLKAVGVGSYEGVPLSDLSIYKDENGVPKFKGMDNVRVTVSHDNGVAVAFVVIE